MTSMICEISASSRHQRTGLETLNANVTEMDESTQRNAAMTEQAAPAAGSMQEQALQLSDAMGVVIPSAAASKTRDARKPAFADINRRNGSNGSNAALLPQARTTTK